MNKPAYIAKHKQTGLYLTARGFDGEGRFQAKPLFGKPENIEMDISLVYGKTCAFDLYYC